MYGEDQGLIQDLESWKTEYRKDKSRVWVIVTLSNDITYFFKDYSDWYRVIDIARANNMYVKEVGLRYRSNVYRQQVNCDGVYLIRSALGSPGAETMATMTIGTVKGNTVFKNTLQLPSLIVMDSYEDKLENCPIEVTLVWR